MSSNQLQAMLDTQLNVFTLGSLHKGKPRQVSRTQYDAMMNTFVQELVGWIDSFQLKFTILIESRKIPTAISMRNEGIYQLDSNKNQRIRVPT